jgi:hypothetical protein
MLAQSRKTHRFPERLTGIFSRRLVFSRVLSDIGEVPVLPGEFI